MSYIAGLLFCVQTLGFYAMGLDAVFILVRIFLICAKTYCVTFVEAT